MCLWKATQSPFLPRGGFTAVLCNMRWTWLTIVYAVIAYVQSDEFMSSFWILFGHSTVVHWGYNAWLHGWRDTNNTLSTL